MIHSPKDPPRSSASTVLVTTMVAMVICLLASCANPRGTGTYDTTSYLGPDGSIITARGARLAPASTQPRPEPAWSWNDDGVSGPPSIEIAIGEQTARFFKGGTLVGHAPVCTGNDRHPTPTGSFRVQEKNANHVSNLYGDFVNANGEVVVANVGVKTDKRPPGTRFRGASMPNFLRVTGGVGMHAGYLPGYPDSHGCIRLPDGASELFFHNAPIGTPVKIVP